MMSDSNIFRKERADAIVFYDGLCALCNHSVRFILNHDPDGVFSFSTLDSVLAQKLLDATVDDLPDSVVLFMDNTVYTRTDASLRIARRLTAPYRWLAAFLLVPRPLRDAVYNLIARNRYRWFGKHETCPVPSPEMRQRLADRSVVDS